MNINEQALLNLSKLYSKILGYLLMKRDADGNVTYQISELSDELGVSKRSALQKMNQLEQYGAIKTKKSGVCRIISTRVEYTPISLCYQSLAAIKKSPSLADNPAKLASEMNVKEKDAEMILQLLAK
jgi:CTP-dependent riboflavin kinase